MSGLSTHVLDLARGRPAAGVRVRLTREGGILFEGETNEDGRCPDMLGASPLQVGLHQLEFWVADYFRSQGAALDEPPFLDRIRIEFGVSDAARRHHVPLLVSPYGYSAYRGS